MSQLRLAVMSCSNFPAGYFNVYAEVAKRTDIDVALHLGDYIYEYGLIGYASQLAFAFDRESQPSHEILTLDDYRRRHAQYRTDADLRAMHANVPERIGAAVPGVVATAITTAAASATGGADARADEHRIEDGASNDAAA